MLLHLILNLFFTGLWKYAVIYIFFFNRRIIIIIFFQKIADVLKNYSDYYFHIYFYFISLCNNLSQN